MNFVYNVAKGRVVELANRVEQNDPTNSAFVIVVVDVDDVSDATLKDLDTLAAILATNADEVTNSGYARKTLANGSLTLTLDDTADEYRVDIADQTWDDVAAGDAWTDLIVCYDSDTTGGTDSNVIPLTHHDFSISPDGSSISAQIDSDGIFAAGDPA